MEGIPALVQSFLAAPSSSGSAEEAAALIGVREVTVAALLADRLGAAAPTDASLAPAEPLDASPPSSSSPPRRVTRAATAVNAAADDRVLLSIAPMMEVTDRHYRYMMRHVTRKTRLYTEMLVDDTLHHQLANIEEFIGFDPIEQPVAVQLGGNNAEYLADAAALCEARGYDEVNLNCGCPSPRVSQHEFGARLMLNPALTRDICHAMMRRVQSVPVTCKCRLGAERDATYEEFLNFVDTVAACGVTHFIVHARVCILEGLSTKANRSVPPLHYDWVKRAAVERPQLQISLNGGVKTLAAAKELLDWRGPDAQRLESVMIGRAAWHTPWIFADADRAIFGVDVDSKDGTEEHVLPTRRNVVQMYGDYVDAWHTARGNKGGIAGGGASTLLQDDAACESAGCPGYRVRVAGGKRGGKDKTGKAALSRPVLNLFRNERNGGSYRKHIAQEVSRAHRVDLNAVVAEALAMLSPALIDAPPKRTI